ncbi:hypothetical protein ACWED2_30755 [Amycolatopsis sp. NPDC005003]
MPYAVWLEMTAPEPITDAAAAAQLPGLIVELLETGWEVPAVPWLDDEDDNPAVTEDDAAAGPGLLDMRVLGYRDGAMIGLAIDTDILEIATTIGASLGRHLADAAPAPLGWTTESLRATKLTAPDPDGDWLPPLREDGPRFPVAEHLRHDLLEMAAQFLIAGAVRDLHDPTGESRHTPEAVDAADLVAGAVTQHPWGREVAGELGTLLIAAGRHEATSGARLPLTGHGGGDTTLAQQLLEAVRAEIDQQAIDYDDDRMRGHVLVEDFMEHHDLQWNRRSRGRPAAPGGPAREATVPRCSRRALPRMAAESRHREAPDRAQARRRPSPDWHVSVIPARHRPDLQAHTHDAASRLFPRGVHRRGPGRDTASLRDYQACTDRYSTERAKPETPALQRLWRRKPFPARRVQIHVSHTPEAVDAGAVTLRPLTGHGGGDSALAQQLLETVRGEIDQPAIDYDDADERRSREQLRALLWAGLRVLATLTHDLTDHAPSPWLWLADLECTDLSSAVGVFAELDDERLTVPAPGSRHDSDTTDNAAGGERLSPQTGTGQGNPWGRGVKSQSLLRKCDRGCLPSRLFRSRFWSPETGRDDVAQGSDRGSSGDPAVGVAVQATRHAGGAAGFGERVGAVHEQGR